MQSFYRSRRTRPAPAAPIRRGFFFRGRDDTPDPTNPGRGFAADDDEETVSRSTARQDSALLDRRSHLADLFKYRNKIGMDVALESLHDAWRHRRFTMDEIDRYARVCRVGRVMRPYLESLVA